eukprot:TRINITY_DN11037_c0_g1_i1.p1 TRINITY_DN11037_c0_g1~~TRINITY_DN11037_c0_g1_i1.p1  ORF type:complete len:119 (-),score=27.06 TRINITY_DN11037_c0_g1_i1:103-459(-)
MESKNLAQIIQLLHKSFGKAHSVPQKTLFMHCFEYLHSKYNDNIEFNENLMDALLVILNKESNDCIRDHVLSIIAKYDTMPHTRMESIQTSLIQCLRGNKSIPKTVQIFVKYSQTTLG